MTDATSTNPANNNGASAEPKLSRREKLIAKYTKLAEKAHAIAAELNALRDEITGIDALAAVDVGSAVVVSIGKGDDAKDVDAVVVGVKLDDDGEKVFKVQYGTGFDADIAVVKQGKIKLPAPSEATPEAHGYPE